MLEAESFRDLCIGRDLWSRAEQLAKFLAELLLWRVLAGYLEEFVARRVYVITLTWTMALVVA